MNLNNEQELRLKCIELVLNYTGSGRGSEYIVDFAQYLSDFIYGGRKYAISQLQKQNISPTPPLDEPVKSF